jgi:hypothetical protein
MTRPLFIEELLWKPREDERAKEWAGHRNFWTATDSLDGRHLRQTAGINPIAKVGTSRRRPAIAVFITPAGEGNRLPWLDEVDIDSGFVRYFGDNKPSLARPAERAPGNNVLLDEMNLQVSDRREDRLQAAPLLFFMNHGGSDGVRLTEFLGVGLIKQAHRVTQLHRGHSFSNYAFDCVLFRGSEDDAGAEFIDMSWIDDRRNPSLEDEATLGAAPASWIRWLDGGVAVLDSRTVRRFVIRAEVWPYADQVPHEDSRLGRVLLEIYQRYDGSYKHGFQALAALTTQHVITVPGFSYHGGWITPVGPDGGVDFVQRMDLGSGFSSTKLVVLGQAKCRKPWPRSGNGVTAEELARVVARLRRGWIGAYVTTSFFTDAAQKEMQTDEYPIVMIHGRRLAQAAEELRDSLGHSSITALLDWVDIAYARMLKAARPRPYDIVREWAGSLPEDGNGAADEDGLGR